MKFSGVMKLAIILVILLLASSFYLNKLKVTELEQKRFAEQKELERKKIAEQKEIEQKKLAEQKEQDKARNELKRIIIRLADANEIAMSSPRITLPSAIKDIQKIKQDVDDLEFYGCMRKSKDYIYRGIALKIDAYMNYIHNSWSDSPLYSELIDEIASDEEAFDGDQIDSIMKYRSPINVSPGEELAFNKNNKLANAIILLSTTNAMNCETSTKQQPDDNVQSEVDAE